MRKGLMIVLAMVSVRCFADVTENLDRVKLFFASNVSLDREAVVNFLADDVAQTYYRIEDGNRGEPIQIEGKENVLKWLDMGLFSRAKEISVLSVSYEPIEDQEAFDCHTYITYQDGSHCSFHDVTQLWFDTDGHIYRIVKNVERS